MSYLVRTVLANLYFLVLVEDVFHGMHLLRQKQDINLIILDIDYQTKESMDFMLHIKSSKIYNKPLIVLSSVQHHKSMEGLIKSCAYDHFVKPFNPIELVNSINELTPSVSLS